MAKLRELSLVLGGAQYFKKRVNDTATCQKCFKPTQSRLTHHAYSHLDVQIFQCSECQLGHPSRDQVVKHMKDLHNSSKAPIDNRLKYAQEIKDSIKECYPDFFIDAPIPTTATVEKLKGSIDLTDTVLGGFDESNEHENDENVSDGEENHVEDEEVEGEQQNETHEAEEDDEIPKLFPNDAIEEEAMEEESNDASAEA
uniref:C2H2-type domain-containing protein n=1 Tax=Panagrolaimus sp. ES5 TaxID=591445 RepID=A0AC34GG12_9BILA